MQESEAVSMADRVRIDQLADEIMKGLKEYADLATDEMKAAVKDAGKLAKEEIAETAPKDTGKYAKSWTSKVTAESSDNIKVTVYSPKKYQLRLLPSRQMLKLRFARVTKLPAHVPARLPSIL